MSLKSWKKEFYPKPANETSKMEALEHSLRKWTGATPANCKKHRVRYEDHFITDDESGDYLSFCHESCSLCFHYYKKSLNNSPCNFCPLFLSRNNTECDNSTSSEDQSPYLASEENPTPMIKALRKAIKWQNNLE